MLFEHHILLLCTTQVKVMARSTLSHLAVLGLVHIPGEQLCPSPGCSALQLCPSPAAQLSVARQGAVSPLVFGLCAGAVSALGSSCAPGEQTLISLSFVLGRDERIQLCLRDVAQGKHSL